jgi:hypothetical protein
MMFVRIAAREYQVGEFSGVADRQLATVGNCEFEYAGVEILHDLHVMHE